MNQPIASPSQGSQHNRLARTAALSKVSWPVNLSPATVSYQSLGHLLIIGGDVECRTALAALQGAETELTSVTLLLDSASVGSQDRDVPGVASYRIDMARQGIAIRGYLGCFEVELSHEGAPVNLAKAVLSRDYFDLILDLGKHPCLTLELPPPGYFACQFGTPAYTEALAALPEHIGEFDKPKYFHIDHDICAHDGRGQRGCTRCLEVCPADAIASRQKRIEAWIEIDPFLCHGAGSCTTACPTGAIQYRLPEPHAQQDYAARLIEAYRESGGTQPVVRFVERAYLDEELPPPAGHILDIPLEELGAAGLDHWLGALADGACEVRVQWGANLPGSMIALLDDQLAQARTILDALGLEAGRLTTLDAGDSERRDELPAFNALPSRSRSAKAAHGKRARLNDTLASLTAAGHLDAQRHGMPDGAPFGAVVVDNAACTLCMSCVSICPTKALGGGKDKPLLSFLEADCVQCGLCASACPEDAIALMPGFLAAPQRLERQICKEEAAFECIVCSKPFATVSTIASIKAKLAAHPYFAGDAMARLEMCEDCRVKDVWHEMARNPDAQLKV
ncbi:MULTISPECIES: 4Fe-4S binding protein [Halomonadaceae]|uniref:4Fe-4S binding protein n=1 Tax=Halomonadaceae TaxID=28256 RepID=UPI0015985E61|nr:MULTISPECIES: 4Fe-4S binding protein [Halomonas]QJQ96618.1 4Fe-4S binding protein [Halomonas sp. PA5]